MIVWINGAFGAGKTTLAGELHRRLPEALQFDPEYVGYMLARWVPEPPGDFQDIPLWRTMTARFALELRAAYGRPLIVPMTLVDPGYQQEIFAAIRAGETGDGKTGDGEELLLHVFLDVPAAELRRRIDAQVLNPDDAEADAQARAFRHQNVARCVAARDLLPAGTLVLRGDQHTPAGLAGLVLAELERRLRRVPR